MSDNAPQPPVIRRCEVRNGRRYIDGVDQGPADLGGLSGDARAAAQRGANRRGRRRK